ncbi:MAG: nucleotidyltransferase domain-containing protein [Bdellovibrio sp.]|nr:nucleotidyltransferase domain-containing protein [Bdellovibrio sp.]
MIKPLGLLPEQIDFIERTLQELLKNKRVINVSIFGSRVRGDYRQYSDLDLWIESTPELSRSEESTLRLRFEESDLPIKIDIVTPESCHADYRENIMSEKKLWFSSSPP